MQIRDCQEQSILTLDHENKMPSSQSKHPQWKLLHQVITMGSMKIRIQAKLVTATIYVEIGEYPNVYFQLMFDFGQNFYNME